MIRGAVAVATVLVLSGCGGIVARQPATTMPPATVRASQWPAPDNGLTPGAMVPGCVYPRIMPRNVTSATKAKVRDLYHFAGKPGEYDHRQPEKLCGNDGPGNIWPEPADGYHAYHQLNRKDQLEVAIYRLIDQHVLKPTEAAALFAAPNDWRHEWCVYVRSPEVVCDI